jgi:hypothetical protein
VVISYSFGSDVRECGLHDGQKLIAGCVEAELEEV